jgi:hypothetical protein
LGGHGSCQSYKSSATACTFVYKICLQDSEDKNPNQYCKNKARISLNSYLYPKKKARKRTNAVVQRYCNKALRLTSNLLGTPQEQTIKEKGNMIEFMQ